MNPQSVELRARRTNRHGGGVLGDVSWLVRCLCAEVLETKTLSSFRDCPWHGDAGVGGAAAWVRVLVVQGEVGMGHSCGPSGEAVDPARSHRPILPAGRGN